MQTTSLAPDQVEQGSALLHLLEQEMSRVIVGQKELIRSLILGVLTGGHLLLEGVPGIAKTLAVNTLAAAIECDFKRVQFTPDLLPADLMGTEIYRPQQGHFEVKKGPIFTNLLLADEINRAPAKVQAALLEIMQEKQVTIGGVTYAAPDPFLVVATQNPIEQEGTYPLAEAQTDRFMMKVVLHYPSLEEEKEILQRMGGAESTFPKAKKVVSVPQLHALQALAEKVYLDPKVSHYLLDLVHATRDPRRYGLSFEKFVEFGASPRATLALLRASKGSALLMGRGFVVPQDLQDLAPSVLRHRIRLSYEGEAEGWTSDRVVSEILSAIPVP